MHFGLLFLLQSTVPGVLASKFSVSEVSDWLLWDSPQVAVTVFATVFVTVFVTEFVTVFVTVFATEFVTVYLTVIVAAPPLLVRAQQEVCSSRVAAPV